jgi:hypothetical protein
MNIYILCKLHDKLPIDEHRIKLSDHIIDYKGKKIKIFSENYIKMVIMAYNYPFL